MEIDSVLNEINKSKPILNNQNEIHSIKCGFISFNNNKFIYSCIYCHQEYTNINNLEKHLIDNHINISSNSSYDPIHENVKFNCTEEHHNIITIKNFLEDNNDKLTKDIDDSQRLLKINNFSESDFSTEEESKNNINTTNIQIRFLKTLSCHICDKTYTNNNSLKLHFQKEHSKFNNFGQFKCQLCGHLMKNEISLKRHLKEIHKNINAPIYQCESCDLGFKTETRLILHVHKIHTLEPTFPCKTCGKHFINVGNMKVHERIHTGEKPFQCEICGKKFVRSNNLDVHKRRHLSDRHIKCELCDKMFYTRTSMEDHLISHSNQKNFSCEFCETKFARKGDKLKHLKMKHSEYMTNVEKKYVCTICNADFALRVGFRQHMKSEHDVTLCNLNAIST